MVHNLCLQQLTGVEDEPDFGFLCGGVKCRKVMSVEEKQSALHTDGKPAEGPEREDQSSGTCSAGDNCSAKPGEASALSATCTHGQPRHFVCARAPCPDNCGTTPDLEDTQGKVRQEVVDVDSGEEPDGRGAGAGVGAQSTSAQKDTTESAAAEKTAADPLPSTRSTPKPRRVPTRSRGTPTTPCSTPTTRASPDPTATVGEYKAIKAAVCDSITTTLKSPEFQAELAKVVSGNVTKGQAIRALSNSVNENSSEFIKSAKQAGVLAVAEHLEAPLKAAGSKLAASSAETTKVEQKLVAEWKGVAEKWKLNTAVAAASKPATKPSTRNAKKTGKNGSKGAKADTQDFDQDDTQDDLAAAAKAGAAAVSKTLRAFVKEECAQLSIELKAASTAGLAEQSVELNAASTAGLTEQTSELKATSDAQLKEHFGLWTTSSADRITEQSKLLQDAFRVQVEEQTELLKARFEAQITEAVQKLSEQVGCVFNVLNQQIFTGIQQIDRSISAGQKRGSRDENDTPPRQPDGRRRSPKRHQATRRRDEAGGMMGTSSAMGQGDLVMLATAMGNGIAQGNANRNGMAQSATNRSVGGPSSFGAGQFGTGIAAGGVGLSSQGMASHGIAVGVPSQGMVGHTQGVPTHSGPYMQAFGQIQGPQGNGMPPYLYR